LKWAYRRATWRGRSLPDFIIIGAQKSGTSSLFEYLCQHPQLVPSYVKEVHYFDGGLNPNIDNFEKGEAWYRAHFPLTRAINPHSKTFEASPLYLFNPRAPERIFRLIPEVKIIALLRDPTARAISHYFHEKRRGRESLPIFEALRLEEKRLESVVREEDYKSDIFIHHSYKSRGLYKQQIERFLGYFPWHQIFLVASEELFRQPEEPVRRIFEFVGVDPNFKVSDLRARNVAHSKDKVEAEVYRYLQHFFSPHNEALYELIGKNYAW
jgi:hypothetical protein